jgi:hypothetical protein
MQASGQEQTSLRRAIRHWLERKGWRKAYSQTSLDLAKDLGLPTEAVSRVLDRTAAELREFAWSNEDGDARPIINRAIKELAQYGYRSQPFQEAAMNQYLQQLGEPDITILRHFQNSMPHADIASRVGMDVEAVRRSLVKTYADLRMKMTGWDDDDDGEHAAPPAKQPAKIRAISQR